MLAVEEEAFSREQDTSRRPDTCGRRGTCQMEQLLHCTKRGQYGTNPVLRCNLRSVGLPLKPSTQSILLSISTTSSCSQSPAWHIQSFKCIPHGTPNTSLATSAPPTSRQTRKRRVARTTTTFEMVQVNKHLRRESIVDLDEDRRSTPWPPCASNTM